MYKHETAYRVLYADTDRMGFLYYGGYARLLEIGRVELIRSLGLSYRELEDQGFFLPVSAMQIKYVLAARYDDVLRISTSLPHFPAHYRLLFEHKMYNQEERLVARASVTLYILDADRKPTAFPDCLLDRLRAYF